MAAWQAFTETAEPGEITKALAPVRTALDTVSGQIMAAETELLAATALATTLAFNPAIDEVGRVLQAFKETFETIVGAGVYQLTTHPWTPGLGNMAGLYRTLPWHTMISAIAGSITDAGDDNRPRVAGTTQLVCLAAAAPSVNALAARLAALAKVAPQMRVALARAEQAIALAGSQHTHPRGSTPPDWQALNFEQAVPAMQPYFAVMRQALAAAEGYAKGVSTASDLVGNAITKQIKRIGDIAKALDGIQTAAGSAGMYVLSLDTEGGAAALPALIREASGAPGGRQDFCAAVTWVAGGDVLTPLRQLLQVSE